MVVAAAIVDRKDGLAGLKLMAVGALFEIVSLIAAPK